MSVCLSVTRRHSVKTAKHIIQLFSPSGTHTIKVLQFDLLWARDSHEKGQISKYLAAWVHTWTTACRESEENWLDNITEDCEHVNLVNLTIHQASRLANDRVEWRNNVCNKGCQSAGTSSSSYRGFKSKRQQERLLNQISRLQHYCTLNVSNTAKHTATVAPECE